MGGIFRKSAIFGSSLLLCCLLFAFLHNLKPQFQKTEKEYAEKIAVNLSPQTPRADLSAVLYNNGYVTDRKDADFVADTLTARLKRMPFSNLYRLQKRAYGQVPMLVADSLGVLGNRIEASKERIGVTGDLPPADSLPSELDLHLGEGAIAVSIRPEERESCNGVIVRLTTYYHDSLGNAADSVAGYAKTDRQGKALFRGLDKKRGYSVLPIRRGYEYGAMRGVHSGKFKRDTYPFVFQQQEHRVQMMGNATLKQIKNDGTLTVRTPSEYKATVVKWFVLVILGWWLLWLVMVLRKKRFDPVIIAAAMLLTGFCVLMMFSIQNPLTEELRGVEMATGVLMGLAVVIAAQFIDFVKFYQNRYPLDFDIVVSSFRWLFLPFKRKVAYLAEVLKGYYPWYKKTGALLLLVLCLPFGILNLLQIHRLNGIVEKLCRKLPKGLGWLVLAIILTALLWTPLGQEVGGMKVNLRLGSLTFQPSEMAKYLILFFMAAFFTQSADTIIEYSRPTKTRMMGKIWSKVKTLGWVIVGLAVLMGMYAALGDMGPALVIGIAFVLLYSLVKSKVNLENLSEDDKWRRIFTCDFAMLLYGVASFAACIIAGYFIGNALVGALFWFVAWIAFGLLRHRQFFETAVLMNLLVFTFVFGGQLMQKIPALAGTDTAERFEQRTRMCVNTWGELDAMHAGAHAEAVSNTQVANGLWGIATGGLTGQGLGKGNPNLIPAFHTDMILSSIGEQTGLVGMVLVLLVLALLLRRMMVAGYKAGHPFAFYFCIGAAIVTGVQFFIIVLGSSGMVPLTGITVPFLSYGRVSMILNLVAVGVVLSFSQNEKAEKDDAVTEEVRKHSVGEYNYPASIVSWTFVALALFTMCVWHYYGFWKRGETLVHPAFVHNSQGTPLIEYNPRIALLTKAMWAGNIYDRNGLLLATSDKNRIHADDYDDYGIRREYIENMKKSRQRRYYPFGEHLFFMVGDQNNGLFFSYNENNPTGYMAEVQHLAYLRDYDNILRDKNGNAVRVWLAGKAKGRFIDGIRPDTLSYVVRDHKALVKYLEKGPEGLPLKAHNERVCKGNYDLYLTVDAQLQTNLQNRLSEYAKTPALKGNPLLRISVVVLDAENGDLLTSANYPIPDYQRLREEDLAGNISYSDNCKDIRKWKAYTDRDLGLTYQTMPGSTAKVMSAMAGLQKLGPAAADRKYLITQEEIIERGKASEPHGYDVTMRDAIVRSSNCYFINLVNDNELYWNLDSVYEAVGTSIGGIVPYFFAYDGTRIQNIREKIRQNEGTALVKYQRYKEGKTRQKMNEGEWRWAWGQGYEHFELQASPLNMARVAAAVVNDGVMPTTQYVMPIGSYAQSLRQEGGIPLLSATSSKILRGYMLEEAANQKRRNRTILPAFVGGKTGTPERYRIDREIRYYNRWTKSYNTRPHVKKMNDGWYMFFIEGSGCANGHPLAVAVRMERSTGSGAAVRLTKAVILEALYECGYLNDK